VVQKQTGTNRKTKRAIILKTNRNPENGMQTNRKTKQAMLLKIKDWLKTNRKKNLSFRLLETC